VLCGKPLVQWAIDTALEAQIFGKIIVSSDDEEIVEMAYDSRVKPMELYHKYGLVIPHYRPKSLAEDNIQIRQLVRYLISTYSCGPIFCVLTPCNPFRTAQDIRECYDLIFKKKANYVMSVKRASPPPQWACRIENKFLEMWQGHRDLKRAQELEPLYYHDGGVIFAVTEAFLHEFDKDFHGTRCYPYFMKHSLDIDTKEDLMLAEVIMARIGDG